MNAWKKMKKKDAKISTWNGGETAEYIIEPFDAQYSERDFLWRISSASVELESSFFTSLPAYQRYIVSLDKEIVLQHNQREKISLKPLEIHYFDGADTTYCEGCCTDLNLMLRKDKADGRMEELSVDKKESFILHPNTESIFIYCVKGESQIFYEENKEILKEKECLYIEKNEEKSLLFFSDSIIIIAQMWKDAAVHK